MRRTAPIIVRTARWMSAIGIATLLASCAGTVQGAAAAGTAMTLTGATNTSSTSTTPPTSSSSRTTAPSSSVTSEPITTSTGVDPSTDVTDDDSYTGLSIGDTVWTQYDTGAADVTLRSARFENSEGSHLLITVDYECYDGEFDFDLIDWTVTDAAGDRHHPGPTSGFGADDVDEFGTIDAGEQVRGHLSFDLPAGAVTVNYDELSGDPATWLVPAA